MQHHNISKSYRAVLCGLTVLLALLTSTEVYSQTYDLVVYGGTSAGVIAAVQARKMGKTAVIVGPDKHLGGLTSGGLGWTDTGRKEVIGGLSRDFYHRIWKEYQRPETWKFERKSQYGGRGQGNPAIDGANRTMWIFEPHVAEKVYEDYVREFKIPVHRDQWLDRKSGVELTGGRIVAITMLSGDRFQGKMFVDATYEGDLMAAAGVTYHVGREGKEVYGEDWNGVQTGELFHRHHFDAIPNKARISPYVIADDPKSGVLPHISPDPPGKKHAGDDRIQAYCFRMCLTNTEANRIPFAKPDNYDPKRYELLARIFAAGWDETFDKFDPIPNRKTDTNNHGPMSTDNIGANYGYPKGTYAERRAIFKDHEEYQQGLMYFIANDPGVPEKIRNKMSQWGLTKDEFTDNGGWPHQLYIRESRRMVGKFVMTENELLKRKPTPESVGMGSYTIDSHNVQRYITLDGYVQNEGDIGVKCTPYEISLGSLLPKKEECENLIVPVCVSSSHIAFGSMRMEPVFMILGQSGATAACMAIDNNTAVQDVKYDDLKTRLRNDGQTLNYELVVSGSGVDPRKLSGIVIDDSKATLKGKWSPSTSYKTYLGTSYMHDSDGQNGESTATFQTDLPKPGTYEVRLAYTPNKNRSTKTPVAIEHADGRKETTVNQKEPAPIDGLFVSLGTYRFDKSATVTVTNKDTDGYVIIDGLQLIRQ